jgi:hypothetical protein
MTGPRLWNLDKAIRRRSEGWTFQKIAEEAGVSYTAIIRCFKVRGLDTCHIRRCKHKP